MNRLRFYIRCLLLGSYSLLLCSCTITLFGKGTAQTVYLLEDLGNARKESFPKTHATLLLRATEAPEVIDNRHLLFKRDELTLDYYKYSSWAVTPPSRFNELLYKRLALSGIFGAVLGESAAVPTDLVLNTRLAAFYHEARQAPGKVFVEVYADLVSLPSRTLLSQERFQIEVPLKEYKAEGAVFAFSKASTSLLDQLVEWLAMNTKSVK